MKKIFGTVFLLALSSHLWSADALTSYRMLQLPVSAHLAALGGVHGSVSSDDLSLFSINPAQLVNVSPNTVGIGLMSYMRGSMMASASFAANAGEKGACGVAAVYANYGNLQQTSTENESTGTFSAYDMMLSGTYARLLGTYWAGGLTIKMISGRIETYSSLALAADLGVNYYDEEKGWSVSLAALNVGAQIKAFNDVYEKLPINTVLSVTKQFAHVPLQLSFSYDHLHDFSEKFSNHLSVGAEFSVTPQVWVGAGYNFRRASELSLTTSENKKSSHGAGLSVGGGVHLTRFRMDVSYAQYHVSGHALALNIAYIL